MRLLGILLGAVIAVAALIVIIGLPELGPAHSDRSEENAAEPARLPLTIPEPAAQPLAVTQAFEAVPPAAAPYSPEQSVVSAAPVAAPPAEPTATTVEPPPDAQRWYAFWSPFRSRIAADGFVTQLQRVTGLDYRVVNVKPGVYEVAFAYGDEDEIQSSLTQISAATGLEVPES